jgi:hypothetical protein
MWGRTAEGAERAQDQERVMRAMRVTGRMEGECECGAISRSFGCCEGEKEKVMERSDGV